MAASGFAPSVPNRHGPVAVRGLHVAVEWVLPGYVVEAGCLRTRYGPPLRQGYYLARLSSRGAVVRAEGIVRVARDSSEAVEVPHDRTIVIGRLHIGEGYK